MTHFKKYTVSKESNRGTRILPTIGNLILEIWYQICFRLWVNFQIGCFEENVWMLYMIFEAAISKDHILGGFKKKSWFSYSSVGQVHSASVVTDKPQSSSGSSSPMQVLTSFIMPPSPVCLSPQSVSVYMAFLIWTSITLVWGLPSSTMNSFKFISYVCKDAICKWFYLSKYHK